MKEGLPGGQYNVLSESDLERIHAASLRILQECGVKCDSPALREVYARGGVSVDHETGMVRVPADAIEWALKTAPRSFVLYGRDPAYDLLLEQPRVYYGLGGSAEPMFWDLYQQVPRPSVLADVVAATRVGHVLPNVDFVMSLAAANDVPADLHYLYEYDAILRHTSKPVIYSATDRRYARMFLELAAAASGGEGELRRRPSIVMFGETDSPLRFGAYIEGMLDFAEWGAPIIFSTGPMAGATGPATMAGMLAMGNAETLAVDVIEEVGPGGHFLLHDHTARSFRREFFFPQLFDRYGVEVWQNQGSRRVDEVARDKVRQILAQGPWLALPASVEAAMDEVIAGYIKKG